MLTLLTVLGAREMLRQHRRAALSLLAVVLIFPVPYYLTHSSMDYRQPIEPEIVVLIVIGGAKIVEIWRRRLSAKARPAAVLVAN